MSPEEILKRAEEAGRRAARQSMAAPPPLRILALDCATITGWATNAAGSVESGTQKFGLPKGASTGMRFLSFRLWVTERITQLRPDLVLYEQPGRQQRSGAASELLYGFTTRVVEIAEELGVPCRAVAPAAVKGFATGNGNASKEAMQAAAAERFPHYRADDDEGANEADALLIFAWGAAGMPEFEPAKKGKRAKPREVSE